MDSINKLLYVSIINCVPIVKYTPQVIYTLINWISSLRFSKPDISDDFYSSIINRFAHNLYLYQILFDDSSTFQIFELMNTISKSDLYQWPIKESITKKKFYQEFLSTVYLVTVTFLKLLYPNSGSFNYIEDHTNLCSSLSYEYPYIVRIFMFSFYYIGYKIPKN